LEERFVNEEIKMDLYEKFIAKFKEEEAEIKEQMQGCPISNSNLEKYINRTIELSTELSTVWASSDYIGKQRLQKLIFGEGIYYNKQKDETRTTKINAVFSVIASLQGIVGVKKEGLQNDISLKSLSVPCTGIEPVIPP
jgi:site-specific DNA recombinase